MQRKIAKWLEDGLIDNQTAQKMLDEINEDKIKSRNIKINITIYTIAVILIGLGVITFIAANDWILLLLNSSDLLKILLMSGITLASFWGGYKLAYEKQNFPKLGNALIILSTLLIGGTYGLIGQIYHINANSSSLMFLWLISILPVAYMFKNSAINIISIVLMILGFIFFYAELALDTNLIWTIFIPITLGIILYSLGNIPIVLNKYNNFSLSYKIVGIFPIFITFLILTCSVEHSYHITSGYYIVPIVSLIVFNIFNFVLQKNANTLLKIETIFIIVILSALLLLLILPYVNTGIVVLLANVFIIAMLFWGFNYGYKFENERLIGISNWMLILYLLVNYSRWGWSFMDKTLFFIFGGICMLVLGLYLEKRKKNVFRKDV